MLSTSLLALACVGLAACTAALNEPPRSPEPGSTPNASESASTVPAPSTPRPRPTPNGPTPSGPEPTSPVDVLPPECQAALLDVLEAIEPLAATVDWQNPASAELEAVEEVGRAAAVPFDDYTCPPLDRALHGPAFLELARGVGPGSVGYVEHVLSRD